jgi:hypothetical protein
MGALWVRALRVYPRQMVRSATVAVAEQKWAAPESAALFFVLTRLSQREFRTVVSPVD